MLLRVQYPNEKYDYVNPSTLDELIGSVGIRQFYRPSEKQWIDVVQGPLRGSNILLYTGQERRGIHASA